VGASGFRIPLFQTACRSVAIERTADQRVGRQKSKAFDGKIESVGLPDLLFFKSWTLGFGLIRAWLD
jgi:hypothetical protein